MPRLIFELRKLQPLNLLKGEGNTSLQHTQLSWQTDLLYLLAEFGSVRFALSFRT